MKIDVACIDLTSVVSPAEINVDKKVDPNWRSEGYEFNKMILKKEYPDFRTDKDALNQLLTLQVERDAKALMMKLDRNSRSTSLIKNSYKGFDSMYENSLGVVEEPFTELTIDAGPSA